MTREFVPQKTMEFHFGDLSAGEARSYDVDEPTRELPLIAGKFAGREWTAETVTAAPAAGKKTGRRFGLPAPLGLVCALLAVALLIASLMGQAKLVGMNEEAVTLSSEIDTLRREQETLLLRRAEQSPDAGTEQLAAEHGAGPERTGEDRATVLNIRRGRELGHLWESLVDTLGASFR